MSDEDREAILARRRRFLALALSGVTTASTATACACLQPLYDAGLRDAGTDASDAASESDADPAEEDAP